MPLAFLGLGSNEGDRHEHLQAAVRRLSQYEELQGQELSRVYESEAHTLRPEQTQPPFLNAVMQIKTTSSPERVLAIAHQVEEAEGRQRDRRRWIPRPIDIDLLAVGGEVRNSDALTLPHPRLAERRFVLRPWTELAPNFVVPPPFERTVQELLARCPDTTGLEPTSLSLLPSTSSTDV